MNVYRSVLLAWAKHPSFIPFGKRVLLPVDRLLRKTGRPVSALGTGLPTIYLTTTGRKTGKPRTVPLLGVDIPAGIAVIDSNYGTETRPGWFHNLQADPRCRVQQGKETGDFIAREPTASEREAIWARALEVYPPWASYQARVARALDVLVLEPAP